MTTPAEIRQAREAAGLTQAQAAALVHSHKITWAKWEAGTYPIDEARWELFKLKASAHTTCKHPDAT